MIAINLALIICRTCHAERRATECKMLNGRLDRQCAKCRREYQSTYRKQRRATDPMFRQSGNDQAKIYRLDNPEKHRSAVKRWQRANAEHVREYRKSYFWKGGADKRWAAEIKRDFGIAVAEYQAMLAAQGGVCAICKKAETFLAGDKPKRLAVDHDHVTGKVRGLLCFRCNTTIGRIEEDPRIANAMIAYLVESGVSNVR